MPIALPAYPGRGVAAYRDTEDALWWIYFLTGRSDASRARSLHVGTDRLSVVPTGSQAHDQLRHYSCVRASSTGLVVGNGDHVDLIVEALDARQSLARVLSKIEPEPDPPINTARIAIVAGHEITVVSVSNSDGDGEPVRVLESVELGIDTGVILHTYGGDAVAVTTDAVPRRFEASGTATELAERIWESLDPDLAIALAVGRVPVPTPTAVFTAGVPGRENQ